MAAEITVVAVVFNSVNPISFPSPHLLSLIYLSSLLLSSSPHTPPPPAPQQLYFNNFFAKHNEQICGLQADVDIDIEKLKKRGIV